MGPVLAQYKLFGRLTNTQGQPLAGATVYLHELKKGVISDAEGRYQFLHIRPGLYHLHCQYVGHKAKTIDVTLLAADQELNIEMQAATLELSEIIIESDLLKIDQSGQSQAVDVVSAEQIQKYTGVTLMQSLERLPGINSLNTGIGISKPVIRGLSFNRVAVTENGIKQEGQQWGIDHGLEIDPFGVGRVEIIKGPASLLYGSDAMAGVIQLKPAPFPMEGKWQGQINSLYRSVNQQAGLSTEWAGHHREWVWRVRASWQDYGDYKLPADSFSYNRFRLPLFDQRLKNTAGRELHGSATLGIQKNWGFSQLTFSRFSQRLGYFAGALGRPNAYQLQSDGNSRNIDLPYQQLTHNKLIWNTNLQLGKNWLETDIGWQQNLREEHSYPHAHGRQQLDSTQTLAHGMQLQTLSGQLRYHYKINAKHRLISGLSGQYQNNRISGFEFLIPAYSNHQWGIFSIWQYKASEVWQWNAGLRYDMAWLYGAPYSEIMSDGSNRSRAPEINRRFGNVSASAGLAWNPDPHWQLKINLGSSYRIPTLPELSSNGVHHGSFRHEIGDSSLQSERGYQLDLGILYQREKWDLKFTPYLNYYSNYIYLRPTSQFSCLPEGGQMFRYTQGAVFHGGGELSSEFHYIKDVHLAVHAAYTRLTNLSTGVPLPFTPPFQLMLDLEYALPIKKAWFKDPYVGSDLQFFAAQNRTDRNEMATPAYFLMQFHAGSSFVFKKQVFGLRLMVNNVFNTPYFNHLSRYRLLQLVEPGRNLQLLLRWQFG